LRGQQGKDLNSPAFSTFRAGFPRSVACLSPANNGLNTLRFMALTPSNIQRDNTMKTAQFLGTLSSVDRALSGVVAVTLSLTLTTVIAAAFQGAAYVESQSLIAAIVRAFA
jgi:hypothetical protein